MNFDRCAVYIHVPFCMSKCIYCDYNSITKHEFIDQYFKFLEKEIEMYIPEIGEKVISTIYFGGGTPSLVHPRYIEKIYKKITSVFNNDLKEITIEVNPETVTTDLMESYKNIGINRISVGIQSADNDVLKICGRLYNEKKLFESTEIIRNFFDNINFDFINGLPLENENTYIKNHEFIKYFKPEHVSYYNLDISYETKLKKMLRKKEIKLPDPYFVDLMLDKSNLFLKEIGYKHYEISSYAILDKESTHNLFYWQNFEYFGFGVSAGGYYNRSRYLNMKNISEYIKYVEKGKFPYDFKVKNLLFEDFKETLFMGLRLIKGLSIKDLKEKYGEKNIEKALFALEKDIGDLLKINENIFISEQGLNFSRKVFEYIACMEDFFYGDERKS